MKIGIVTRKTEAKWGGDLAALYCFYEGLKEMGQPVSIAQTAAELHDADFIFLSNTSYDLKPDYATLQASKQRFGVIALHSDRPRYYSPCYAFAHFVGLCLIEGHSFYHIEQLIDNPDILDFFPYFPPPLFEENYPLLEQAEICIATSPTEAATIQRDSPGCRTQVIYLPCELPSAQYSDAFLQFTGLKKGEYVLQVGRIEPRKNQLASLLAMRDLDMPLVFIATESFYPSYEQLCLQAIRKWRHAPTLVISQTLPSTHEGSLRILSMPHGQKLSQEMLMSAYQNAGLHLHPAFCELPGLTYLEAAKFGVPTVASEWATINDYFADSSWDEQIVYAPPHDINALTEHILKQWGKKIPQNLAHPLFRKTKVEVARELHDSIN